MKIRVRLRTLCAVRCVLGEIPEILRQFEVACAIARAVRGINETKRAGPTGGGWLVLSKP
jgi:hypothetical protein